MSNKKRLKPSAICFSQHDIASHFSCGESVHGVIDDIIACRTGIRDFLPIEIAYTRDEYYTANNRTLYACRVLEYEGKISEIDAVVIEAKQLRHKMTTRNAGSSVSIRGGVVPRPHSVDQILDKRAKERQIELSNSAVSVNWVRREIPTRMDKQRLKIPEQYLSSKPLALLPSLLESDTHYGVVNLTSLKGRHILPQLMNKEHMAPSSIRFSQNDISARLTRGDSLHGIIDEIKSDKRSIMDFLPMQVANVGGKCYTENNRTLYICRVLEFEKVISTVEVENIPPNRIQWRMTTENEGASVRIRGGVTPRPHSIAQIRQRSQERGMDYWGAVSNPVPEMRRSDQTDVGNNGMGTAATVGAMGLAAGISYLLWGNRDSR